MKQQRSRMGELVSKVRQAHGVISDPHRHADSSFWAAVCVMVLYVPDLCDALVAKDEESEELRDELSRWQEAYVGNTSDRRNNG